MRKTIVRTMTAFLAALVLSCGGANLTYGAKKPLVIAFVHRDNIAKSADLDVDALSSATVYSGATGEAKCTIEVIRDTIQKQTKANVFAVKVKKSYSKDYEATIERADAEIDHDTKLKLKTKKIPKLKNYKTIYLCTPVWHGTLPQPVKMLLKANDFSGKKIYVMGAHLGSGFGENISAVKKLCPGAKVKMGKTYRGDAKNKTVAKSVKKWVKTHK